MFRVACQVSVDLSPGLLGSSTLSHQRSGKKRQEELAGRCRQWEELVFHLEVMGGRSGREMVRLCLRLWLVGGIRVGKVRLETSGEAVNGSIREKNRLRAGLWKRWRALERCAGSAG